MKNKFILGLILGIFLIGLISALSVTGYLVRGGAVSTNDYSAVLKGVGGGVATVAVTTPDGDTRLVQVQEDKSVQVGDITVSASNLQPDKLFRRGAGDIKIETQGFPPSVPFLPLPRGSGAELQGVSQTNVACNGDLINLGSATTFKYWDKKNGVDYHDYLVVNSNFGQSYTLSFRPREDTANQINETDVFNEDTGQFIATDKKAGDVVTIGDVSFTILEVYVTATDKWVLLEAISGTYFSQACTPALCTAQQCIECNGWLVELENSPTTFKYWDKKNNLDYNDYLLVVSNSGQSYTLDFKPREDVANNRNETDVLNKCAGQFIATDKVAGDVITLGDASITVEEVYVTSTDKWVLLEASSGTYFRKMCVPSS